MALIKENLSDAATYRRLVYLLLALALGPIWFVALVTVWSLSLGLVITPFVIPVLIVLAYMTRGFAAVEAELARSLLDVDARAPAARPARPGFWGWLRGQFDGGFWRAQAFLLIRWFAGFPVAVALLTALSVGAGLLFAPAWVPFVHGGAQLGFWKPHTVWQSLALVPAGLLLLPASVLIARPVAVPFEAIAAGLLRSRRPRAPRSGRQTPAWPDRRRRSARPSCGHSPRCPTRSATDPGRPRCRSARCRTETPEVA